MTVVYIAGPMTGLADFNRPAFHAAARVLRAAGFTAVNPAERDLGDAGWTAYMRLALADLVRCDAIILLRGWESSAGARLEAHVAQALGMPVMAMDEAI